MAGDAVSRSGGRGWADAVEPWEHLKLRLVGMLGCRLVVLLDDWL